MTSSIETARRNINGVNFLVGSGEKLDFADETFDIVLVQLFAPPPGLC